MKKLPKDHLLKLFYKIGFFNLFTPDEKLRLAETDGYIKYYKTKEYIIQQGDWDKGVFILLKGNVMITRNEAPTVTISKLKPGAIFGEITFIAETPRTTNVVACEPVTVLKLEPCMLEESWGIALENKIRRELMKILVNRLDKLNKAILKNVRFIPESDRIY